MPTAMVRQTRARSKAKSKAKARTAAVSQTAALGVAKGLTSMSLHSIAFGRALFPQEAFTRTRAEGLGLDVWKLNKDFSEEAARLVAWVDSGVGDALQRKYLRRLLFSVLAPKDDVERARVAEGHPRAILEQFSFSFSYGEGDDATIHLVGGDDDGVGDEEDGDKEGLRIGARSGGLPEPGDVKTTRMQCAYMTRQLMQLMTTFEEVEEGRVLTMKLEYTDATPADYEPPFFRAEREGDAAEFVDEDVFTMAIGAGVNAGGHVGMSASVRTVLDPVAVYHNSQKQQRASSQKQQPGAEQADEDGAGEPDVDGVGGAPADGHDQPDAAAPAEAPEAPVPLPLHAADDQDPTQEPLDIEQPPASAEHAMVQTHAHPEVAAGAAGDGEQRGGDPRYRINDCLADTCTLTQDQIDAMGDLTLTLDDDEDGQENPAHRTNADHGDDAMDPYDIALQGAHGKGRAPLAPVHPSTINASPSRMHPLPSAPGGKDRPRDSAPTPQTTHVAADASAACMVRAESAEAMHTSPDDTGRVLQKRSVVERPIGDDEGWIAVKRPRT